jgi:hypothetical protein
MPYGWSIFPFKICSFQVTQKPNPTHRLTPSSSDESGWAAVKKKCPLVVVFNYDPISGWSPDHTPARVANKNQSSEFL